MIATHLFRRQHPIPLRLMVNPMPCMGDPGQGPLVVLSLKPQVPLHHHHNLRKAKHLPFPYTHNMALAEGELLVGFCQEINYIT